MPADGGEPLKVGSTDLLLLRSGLRQRGRMMMKIIQPALPVPMINSMIEPPIVTISVATIRMIPMIPP